MDATPGAPLHTAFGMLFNYGLLDAGVHSLGVAVTAPGEEPVFVEHAVRVVKPGRAEFVDQLDLSQAQAGIQGNELVLSGVRLRSELGTSTVDLRVTYEPSSQSPVIVAATDSDPSGAQHAALSGGETTLFDASSQAV